MLRMEKAVQKSETRRRKGVNRSQEERKRREKEVETALVLLGTGATYHGRKGPSYEPGGRRVRKREKKP